MTASVVDIRSYKNMPSKIGKYLLEEGMFYLTHNSSSTGTKNVVLRGQRPGKYNQYLGIGAGTINRAPGSDWHDGGEYELRQYTPGRGAPEVDDNAAYYSFCYFGTSGRYDRYPTFHIRNTEPNW